MALIQHWKLDDNAASTTVVATVGTNGTLEGGDNTSAKTVAGPGGSISAGFSLNGTDDRIDISGSSLALDQFSVSIWFKLSTTSGILFGGPSSNQNHSLVVTDTTALLITTGNAQFTLPSLGTTNWHHLLITRDGSNSTRAFLDGTESSTGAITRLGTWSPTRIGYRFNSYHNGSLAQVKVFNSDESANVATLYAEGTGSSGFNPAWAAAYHRRRRASA